MSSVRSAVASALAAPLLLFVAAASAGPAAAQPDPPSQSGLTQQAGAVPQSGTAANGTYYVREVAGGRCLAGTRLATCGVAGTEWDVRNHADGTVQFQEARPSGRCLSLPEALSYPAEVLLNACESAASTDPSVDSATGETSHDRWRIEGFVDGPVTIAHAYPPAGRLAVQGSAVRVSNNSSAMWMLVPLTT